MMSNMMQIVHIIHYMPLWLLCSILWQTTVDPVSPNQHHGSQLLFKETPMRLMFDVIAIVVGVIS